MTIDSIVPAAPARNDRPVSGAETAATPAVNGRQPAAAVETVQAVKAKEAPPSQKELESAVAELNKSVQASAQSLEFSIDTDSKRTVVKIIDQSTKEILRQIPSKEALQLAKSLGSTKGLLIQQEA
ncbi:flagellar protein FlaG [Pseudoduganella violacea]|uniref:Flagellar protein FlaG n=1 Tax=Pseudoduganella violacea TaxID=1715466 RepID=A0A7W5B712_9BURK|nr:flagellar protein FlaG [Pseudoduganella violacea]MBB3117734.1 flagellar protein FlaG [Pseudoduganella violacea]